MPIIEVAYHGLRDKILAELVKIKRNNPNYKILDVGGQEMPFMPDGLAQNLDIQPNSSFTGDICIPETWNSVLAQHWDFVICSHTLEDVRDAYGPLGKIVQVARRGYLEMPHKHTELTVFENLSYPGYCHHRWIFTVQNNTLRIIAKWLVVARFATSGDKLGWLKPELCRDGSLQILWEDGLDFEMIRNDFTGSSQWGCDGILEFYRDELAEGL